MLRASRMEATHATSDVCVLQVNVTLTSAVAYSAPIICRRLHRRLPWATVHYWQEFAFLRTFRGCQINKFSSISNHRLGHKMWFKGKRGSTPRLWKLVCFHLLISLDTSYSLHFAPIIKCFHFFVILKMFNVRFYLEKEISTAGPLIVRRTCALPLNHWGTDIPVIALL